MSITDFLEKQTPENRGILLAIHESVLRADKSVTAGCDMMMGKETIQYLAADRFKYGLSVAKNHVSLHLMPLYGVPALHAKYVKLLPAAKFQKGCINFRSLEEMPMEIVNELMDECAKVDLKALMEQFKANRGSK